MMEGKGKAIGGAGYEYMTLMNMLHVSVSKHLLDEDFTMVSANDFYYDMIGYSKAEYEALYANRPSLYYAQDQDEWNRIGTVVAETIGAGKNEYSIPSRLRRKDGTYLWIRMSGTFTEEYIGGSRVSYTVMTDITDIMQIQQEQTVTYDSLPGFVGKYRVEQDFRFTLLDANDRFLEFFGKDSYRGMDDPVFRKNIERNESVFQEHRTRILTGEPVHFTVCMNSWRGEAAWLQINADCIGWQGGQPVYLVIYIDVTNETELRMMQSRLEKQAEELRDALAQAKRANQAKSDFLSRMSHDIRTPMNAIVGMTDIAAAHIQEPEKVRDCLRKISLSSQHLLGLINDVLDMSRIESGKMALHNDAMSLPEVMENIVAIVQAQMKERNQRFSVRLHCVVHEQFISDALRIRQVFLNILSNACKFTPHGGRITLDVREEGDGQPGIAMFSFTFTDTGIGMKPKFLEHIFETFSREKDSRVDQTEGTGLGMAITQRIVQIRGGTIDVSSEPGKGTVFCVRLPLQIDDTPLSEEPLPNLHIMVADDDAIMCGRTVGMLEQLGVHTDWVSDGAMAVNTVMRAREQGRNYDAIILDWKMPGQDGLQTARRIRELYGQELPILIISAYDWNDIQTEAVAAGVNGFLTKPVFISTLCRALRRYVLGKQTQPAAAEQAGNISFAGRRFLLVEDNQLNREVAAELLKGTGAQIEAACDGLKGVRKFEASPAFYYDAVLMDVQMPVMDGYTAARRIRALPRADAAAVPILAMTADAFAEDISAARAAGMDGHLAKPLDGVTLKREIAKYLAQD